MSTPHASVDRCLFPLPRRVVASAYDAAQRRGTLVVARNDGFEEALADFGLDLPTALRAQLEMAPARVFLVRKGLARGVYVLPNDGPRGALLHPGADRFEALGLDDDSSFVVAISYASEDREVALGLREALEDAGLAVYLIDVAVDPDDPLWWLRFRSALVVSRYFVPILSSHYQSRRGSRVEVEEAWAQATSQADGVEWFPILPAWTESWHQVEGDERLRSLPGFAVDGEEGGRAFASWVGVLACERPGEASEMRDRLQCWGEVTEAGAPGDFDARFPISGGGEAVVRVRDGRMRLMIPPSGVVSMLRQRTGVMDGELLVRAIALRKEGRYEEALGLLCRSVQQDGVNTALAIEVAEALEALGARRDALVAWREAQKRLNQGHAQKTLELVTVALDRLASEADFVGGRRFGEVVLHWQRSVMEDETLALPADVAAEDACRGASGSRDYFDRSRTAAEEGDLALAEGIMVVGARRMASAGGKAAALYLAGRLAMAQEEVRRALEYIRVALDLAPEKDDLLALAAAVLEAEQE